MKLVRWSNVSPDASAGGGWAHSAIDAEAKGTMVAAKDVQKKSMRQLLKMLCYALLGLVLLAGCLIGFFTWMTRPPRDSEVIANFRAHRRAFEHLSDMIQADRQVVRVDDRGAYTTNSHDLGPSMPDSRFPAARHKEYLAALKETGGEVLMHYDDGICVLLWGSGFGGDTVHLEICQRDTEPANQVASIEEFHKTQKAGETAYRRIEGNWYLWADW